MGGGEGVSSFTTPLRHLSLLSFPNGKPQSSRPSTVGAFGDAAGDFRPIAVRARVCVNVLLGYTVPAWASTRADFESRSVPHPHIRESSNAVMLALKP